MLGLCPRMTNIWSTEKWSENGSIFGWSAEMLCQRGKKRGVPEKMRQG